MSTSGVRVINLSIEFWVKLLQGIADNSATPNGGLVKGTPYKSRFLGFRRDITHGRVLGRSVNIPTETSCPPMCILFQCSESCVCMFGCLDWVGWRLVRGEDWCVIALNVGGGGSRGRAMNETCH